MSEDARAQRVLVALAARRWRQADLVRASGIDKNTISDFLNGKRNPSMATLGKIETALELTPGALAALGEDVPGADQPELSGVDDAKLIAELGYRLEHMKRRVQELEPLAQVEQDREKARLDYLRAIDEDSSDEDRWIEREWTMLTYASHEGPWGRDEIEMSKHLPAYIDALIFARDHGLELVEREDEDPIAVSTRDQMAPAARHARSRGKHLQAQTDTLGEESQDTTGTDPA